MKRAGAALSLISVSFAVLSLHEVHAVGQVRTPPPIGSVYMYVVPGVSFEQFNAVPEIGRLASRGGVALMTTKGGSGDRSTASYVTLLNGRITDASERRPPMLLRALRSSTTFICRAENLGTRSQLACPIDPNLMPVRRFTLLDLRRGADAVLPPGASSVFTTSGLLAAVARDVERRDALDPMGILALVVSPAPSKEMDRVGDEVAPLLAVWRPRASGGHTLRSDTTRLDGLVANVDVAPTILQFLEVPIPGEMNGQPIRLSRGSPFELHRLHLEQRRIRLPIQLGQIAFMAFLALVGVPALLYLRRRPSLSHRAAMALQFVALSGLAFPVTVLAGGLLPSLTYGVVVPYLVVTTIAVAGLSLSARKRGPMGPVVFIGAVSLGFVVLDGALGGRAFRMPLMGGTMFDGVRFYGLPNAFVAVPLAGALFVATTLRPYTAFVLLIGVALFAGSPSLGANLGAAATIFIAAGLWWVFTTRGRFGLRELSFVAGVVALGVGVVLLVNQYLADAPTHIGRFAEETGGPGGLVATMWRRLEIGFGMLNDVPIAYVPVLGLPAAAWLARRGPRPIAEGLRLAGEPWRDAIVAVAVSSFLAFFAEDTGVAAAAPGFLFALAPLAYAAFVGTATSKAAPERKAGNE
ncbi:MAG TPA: hypothetical protein VHI54_00630 [Actinomycetota bacterium]|nr:hypothetical protein [Actinomycetota bacterium]